VLPAWSLIGDEGRQRQVWSERPGALPRFEPIESQHGKGGGVIRVFFVPPDSPEWRAWVFECQEAQRALNDDVAEGKPVSPKRAVYGRFKEAGYIAKDGAFAGKCAFCESAVYEAQHGDIEHFRPKGAIKDSNNAPILLEDGKPHPGYYWLAYDHTNLLLSCQLCNQPNTGRSDGRRIGKWNAFPIADESLRAKQPGDEIHEAPLLINPTIEDPAVHLGLDPATGVLFAIAGSPRGEACIEIFGLNLRGLPSKRLRKYQDVKRLVRTWIDRRLDESDASREEEEISAIRSGRDEYAIAGRQALFDMMAILRRVGW